MLWQLSHGGDADCSEGMRAMGPVPWRQAGREAGVASGEGGPAGKWWGAVRAVIGWMGWSRRPGESHSWPLSSPYHPDIPLLPALPTRSFSQQQHHILNLNRILSLCYSLAFAQITPARVSRRQPLFTSQIRESNDPCFFPRSLSFPSALFASRGGMRGGFRKDES